MKYSAKAWGGTCCATYNTCADWGLKNTVAKDQKTDDAKNIEDGKTAASKARGRCDIDDAAVYLRLFATANQAIMAQSYYDDFTTKKNFLNAITSLSFEKLFDVPDHLTTLRGKGGFGTSSQALVDVFFQLTSSEAKGRAIQTLMRFYVSNASPTTDAKMLVTPGYPMNTYSLDNAQADQDKFLSSNDGTYALSAGLKLFFKADDKAVDNY
jgi:hypothetical protein